MDLHEKPTIAISQRDDDIINLLDYLETLAMNWRMIVKATAAAAVISIITAICLPNVYTATARILPPQQDSGLMGMLLGGSGGMGSMAADLLGKGSPADMYVGILNSEAISDRIIDRFKLMDVYDQKYRVETYKELRQNVNIAAGKKDGIISISVDDEDPKRGADIANAYVEELGKLLVKLSVAGAGQNKSFLEERLTKAKVDLAKAEDAMKSFQSRNKVVSVSDQAASAIGGIAQLKAQLMAQEVQLGALRQQFTDETREVMAVKASTADLRRQIARLEGNGAGGSIPAVGDVPALGQEYVRLMREFKIQETLVELLTKQYEMAKLTEAKDVSALQVLQSARVPDKKSKPRRGIIVMVATFSAGFAAMLYAFIRESTRSMPHENHHRLRKILSLLKEK